MSKGQKIELLHAAAFIFSRDNTLTCKEIAAELGMTNPRSLYRWIHTPEWEKALKAFGYPTDAPRTPPRDTTARRRITKDTDAYFDNRGFEFYASARAAGKTEKQAISIVAAHFQKERRVIKRWASVFQWEARRENSV